MRILLAGGGSSGPVSPLLAIAERLQETEPSVHQFLFIGTRIGHPEKKMAEHNGLPYKSIFCGKLRRYFSWQNFTDLFFLLIGVIQSVLIIKRFKPDVIFSAAGFVAVPITWAGWLCGIPSLIHQQDIVPSLSNKLMAPFARRITVAFKKSLNDFPSRKTFFTGNPIRKIFLNGSRDRAIKLFSLDSQLPVLLVFGGGLGAEVINEKVWASLEELTSFCQIIHLVGNNKSSRSLLKNPRYHAYEFLFHEFGDVLAAADLVVSRAGLSALTELSVLAKPSIIISIPHSHQEMNAQFFAEQEAVVVLNQSGLSDQKFYETIRDLLLNQDKMADLSKKINSLAQPQAAEKIIDHLRQICYNQS